MPTLGSRRNGQKQTKEMTEAPAESIDNPNSMNSDALLGETKLSLLDHTTNQYPKILIDCRKSLQEEFKPTRPAKTEGP